MTSDASSRINPGANWCKQNQSASSSVEMFIQEWRRRERVGLAAHGAESSVFTLECQQVKVGDNGVWCCQTEFLPPNFTSSSSSPRPLSRLQSPPSSLFYLSLLTLIHCSRALQFKALRNPPHLTPHLHPSALKKKERKKNCNPNFFFTHLPIRLLSFLPLLSSNYSSASALTSSRY